YEHTVCTCAATTGGSLCIGAQAGLVHSSIPQRHKIAPYRTMRFLSSRTCVHGTRSVLRCGKVILVFGPCEDVRQANAATTLVRKPAVARQSAQNSESRRFQNGLRHTR